MSRHGGQGSFEYILMLSGVLLVVITVVYMMQGSVAQADNTLDAQMKSAGIALDPSYYTPGAKPQFLPSTPADGFGSTTRPNITALITVKDAALNSLQFNWNGTNYSVYDQSLVLALNFDDANLAGDTAAKATDSSTFGNNGIIYGNTKALLHMDEGVGSTTSDESRNKYSCTITGAKWVADGKWGAALDFDGSGDYVSCSGLSVPVNGTASYEMWLRFHQQATAKGQVEYLGALLYQHPANNYLYLDGTSDLFYWAPSNETWHHIVLTYSGDTSTAKLYHDGVATSVYQQGTYHTMSAWSGTLSSGGNTAFNGTMDEFMAYNRVLSASEVTAHYKAGRARHADWEPNGKWGSAMKFDGVDDYVQTGLNLSTQVNNMTVSAWVYASSKFATYATIYSEDGTWASGSRIWMDNTSLLYFYVPNGTTYRGYQRNVNYSAYFNKWTHVAVTFEYFNNGSAASAVYFNGQTASSGVTSNGVPKPSVERLKVGVMGNCCWWFNGSIDELRIWKRALSADEVQMQYRTSLNRYTPNAWFFEFRNESLAVGTYNYTLYTSGGYRKDGASETRTVRVCSNPLVC